MNNNATLAIILVNWNRSSDTLNCIESINKSGYRDYVVFVVDNGSREEQIEALRHCDLDYVLIEAGENLGYTGGNNRGISCAIEGGAEYVLLLNNDTYISPDALQNLMHSALSDRKIGVISPKILFHPRRELIWAAGTSFNHRVLIGRLSGYKSVDSGQFDRAIDVDYVTGCAMLIQTKVISEVVMLCDDYFAVCEDLDYCFRVRDAGYRIRYEPASIVWHIESASSGGQDSPQYVYYQTRNYFLFHNCWAQSRWQLVLSQTYYFGSVTKRAMLFILTRKWRSLLGLWLGIADVVRGRLGRRDYSILRK